MSKSSPDNDPNILNVLYENKCIHIDCKIKNVCVTYL